MMTFEEDFNSRLRWSISHYHDKQLVKGFQLVVGVIKDLTNKKCYGLTTIKLLSYLEIFNCIYYINLIIMIIIGLSN